jgi:uncharacterized protein YyaL (SSP411 family)
LYQMEFFKTFTLTALVLILVSCNSSKEPIGKGEFPPGVKEFNTSVLKEFEEIKKLRGKDYRPRTKHLLPDGQAKYTNRLFLETSPYLLQHAHNPVNWYPWGDEAFKKARELGRPVFLSVGYSTCHWCHVMEEESFEDIEIAKFINENYIAIKVDREERPDVDAIYMSAVQAMTGGGGWPMSVWLTTDRKPFYGGTYFPPRDGDRGSRAGFLTLVKKLREIYDQQPEKVKESGQEIAKLIEKRLAPKEASDLPGEEPLDLSANYYKQAFDSTDGGIARAPKFPSSMPIGFLLRYHRRTGEKEFLQMANLTLTKMAAGGMYDHVAGGFHRYSTDSKWLVPHFEKMLYDNALLAVAYLEAFQVTGNKDYERVTREILDYVLRDMTSPEGGFYSATDADSIGPQGHREEGYFFTWTPAELDQALNDSEANLVKQYYAVTSGGNFEGRNILNNPRPLDEVAKKLKLSEHEARKLLNSAREKLYQVRSKRPAPIRDEKILTAWNGLMISAFAQAGFILNEKKYLNAAQDAANFIQNKLLKGKKLFRSYKDGKAKYDGYLDDYAFYIAAILDLYESTSDLKWLKMAIKLDKSLEEHFEDKKSGGFFMTSHGHEELLAREKPAYDGAEPSGNSIAVLNLLRLQEFTTADTYRVRAEKAFKAFSGTLKENPIALSEMLLAWDFHLDRPKEIILVKPTDKKSETEALLEVLRKQFMPNRVQVIVTMGEELTTHSKIIPLLESKFPMEGLPTAYVCKKGICLLPTSDPKELAKQIAEVDKLKEVQ